MGESCAGGFFGRQAFDSFMHTPIAPEREKTRPAWRSKHLAEKTTQMRNLTKPVGEHRLSLTMASWSLEGKSYLVWLRTKIIGLLGAL